MSATDNPNPTSSAANTTAAPIAIVKYDCWITRLWRSRRCRADPERRDENTPQDDPPAFVALEGKTLAKDISLYSRNQGPSKWRRCTVDSAAPLNLVNASEKELEELGYSVRPYYGKKVKSLGFSVLPVGTVSLQFKFWGDDEVFEEDFHVLPRRWFLLFNVGPRFDLLLGWGWMRAHPRLLLKWTGASQE